MQYGSGGSVGGLAPLTGAERNLASGMTGAERNLASGQSYASSGQLSNGSSSLAQSSGVIGAVAGSLGGSIGSPRGEPSGGMDPIAELLSQLSGVRRATSGIGSHSAQLQQLQMQLQLERGREAIYATVPSGSSSGSNAPPHLLATLHPSSQGQSMTGLPSGHAASMSASSAAAARSASLYSQVVQVAQAPIERVIRRHHQQQAQQQHLQAQIQAHGTPPAPYSFQSHLNGLSSTSAAVGHPLGALSMGTFFSFFFPSQRSTILLSQRSTILPSQRSTILLSHR